MIRPFFRFWALVNIQYPTLFVCLVTTIGHNEARDSWERKRSTAWAPKHAVTLSARFLFHEKASSGTPKGQFLDHLGKTEQTTKLPSLNWARAQG